MALWWCFQKLSRQAKSYTGRDTPVSGLSEVGTPEARCDHSVVAEGGQASGPREPSRNLWIQGQRPCYLDFQRDRRVLSSSAGCNGGLGNAGTCFLLLLASNDDIMGWPLMPWATDAMGRRALSFLTQLEVLFC